MNSSVWTVAPEKRQQLNVAIIGLSLVSDVVEQRDGKFIHTFRVNDVNVDLSKKRSLLRTNAHLIVSVIGNTQGIQYAVATGHVVNVQNSTIRMSLER